MAIPEFLGRYTIGLTVLALGASVYFLDRPASEVYFLPDWLEHLQGVTGGWHDSLPSLTHAFAFTLFTLLIITPVQNTLKAAVCIGWWVLESALEAIQHSSLSDIAVALTPAWLTGLPVFEALPNYAQHGTFDPLDILFAGVGCAAAYYAAPNFGNRTKQATETS